MLMKSSTLNTWHSTSNHAPPRERNHCCNSNAIAKYCRWIWSSNTISLLAWFHLEPPLSGLFTLAWRHGCHLGWIKEIWEEKSPLHPNSSRFRCIPFWCASLWEHFSLSDLLLWSMCTHRSYISGYWMELGNCVPIRVWCSVHLPSSNMWMTYDGQQSTVVAVRHIWEMQSSQKSKWRRSTTMPIK